MQRVQNKDVGYKVERGRNESRQKRKDTEAKKMNAGEAGRAEWEKKMLGDRRGCDTETEEAGEVY